MTTEGPRPDHDRGEAPDDPRQDDEARTTEPEFGPSGYLPGRAARRARKIVLRAPLGVQWIVASVVAGLIVLVAGIVFLGSAGDPPGEPFVEVMSVSEIGDAQQLGELDALAVGAAGRIRVFAKASELGLVYCEESRQLEGEGGRVWSLTGRGLGGAESLDEHPAIVHSGVLYVDPTRTVDAPPPSDEPASPACVG